MIFRLTSTPPRIFCALSMNDFFNLPTRPGAQLAGTCSHPVASAPISAGDPLIRSVQDPAGIIANRSHYRAGNGGTDSPSSADPEVAAC